MRFRHNQREPGHRVAVELVEGKTSRVPPLARNFSRVSFTSIGANCTRVGARFRRSYERWGTVTVPAR